MSWSHSCLRWNTRMALVSGCPPKLTKWVLSAELVSGWLFHRWNIAERPRWTRWTLPSLHYLSSHFLFDSSVLSHWYFIVLLRDTRFTILMSKELRYNLLTLLFLSSNHRSEPFLYLVASIDSYQHHNLGEFVNILTVYNSRTIFVTCLNILSWSNWVTPSEFH